MSRQPVRLMPGVLACVLLLGSTVALAQDRERAKKDDPKDDAKRCASLPEEKRRQTEVCKTEEERREDEYQKLLQARADKEKPKHSSFLQWLHLDGLWMPAQSGARTYGLIGTHMTIADVKGANIFGPPGVLLLMDDNTGKWRIRPALTWGVSLHLTDFKTPGTSRAAQLYLNFTKCWTGADFDNGTAMAGLSLTFKQK